MAYKFDKSRDRLKASATRRGKRRLETYRVYGESLLGTRNEVDGVFRRSLYMPVVILEAYDIILIELPQRDLDDDAALP